MEFDKNLQHIISTALQEGDFDVALLWLESIGGEQITKLILPDQRTPLHYACQHGRVDVAQRLITNCQCSIESKDVQGCTPLHTAAQYGQVETLKYLLQMLFNHEVSGLTVKLTPSGKLSHTLTSMFQQMLSDRHRDQSGNTPLHTACVHGQLDVVIFLTCEIGCDPNITNSEGMSCFHLAAWHGHLPLVRYLVEEMGADVNLEDEHGRSPTYLAAGGGSLEILKYLIEEKEANAHFTTSKKWRFIMALGRSLVHTASYGGHLHVVRYLVEHHGCDPSCKDGKGFTPLHLACQQGHMDIVSYLITEAHCDPNCISDDGRTCLHIASVGGRLDVIKYLHMNHDCQIKCDYHGWVPLHYAALHNNINVSIYLTEYMKTNPDSKGKNNRTPLHCASQQGCLRVVKYLVDTHNCNPLCVDGDECTPLHWAAAKGQLEVVKYFSTLEWNHPAVDKYNETPLHAAALCGHIEVVKFLVENFKSDPHSTGLYNRTPLHYASQEGHLEVVKYLVEVRHCSPLHIDAHQQTSLHRAAAKGQLEVLKYFTLTLGCEHSIRDVDNNTPLHVAVVNKQLKALKLFLEDLNSDPNILGQSNMTPLQLALTNNCIDIGMYLISLPHCDVLARASAGIADDSPLCLAVETRNLDLVKYICNTRRLNPSEILEATDDLAILEFAQNYMDPLNQAAACGDIKTVKQYVEREGWDPSELDKNGNSTFHIAAKHGQLEVVKYLAEALCCDPCSRGQHEQTPLHFASESGHLDIVKYLTDDHHCDPLCVDRFQSTPLHEAAKSNNLDIMKYFIHAFKCDPSVADGKYNTPLHLASLHGYLEMVQFLVENEKCDPSSKGYQEATPLHYASESGHLDIVKCLTDDHHCDPLCVDKFQSTPLHEAAKSNNLIIVKYFIDVLKCDSCVVDGKNNTPLHLASLHGHLEMVEFLVENEKCDPNSKGYQEATPLHYASENGHLDIVQYLVDVHHCDLVCPDEDGNTPLHTAAANGQLKVVRYFTTMRNCSTLVKNTHDNTPLNVAVVSNHIEVVKFFIESLNCDPNIWGHSDMTPLHSALRHRHFNIAKYLITLPHCDVLLKASRGSLSKTSLHFAVETENLEIVSYLCNTRRLDPHHQPDKGKLLQAARDPMVLEFLMSYTDPLHYAVVYGDLRQVKNYVGKEKWDPLRLDRYGNNALHNAAQHGQLEVVQYLTGLSRDPINEQVEILCDPLAKNKYGLTAQDIASQNGHRRVVSYLLRTTSSQPVFQQDVISPPLNIFVIGNSGSGKSTFVKALSSEKRRFGSFVKVKGVTPLTAGIVPTTLLSRMFGNVNIYDFAGHEEYYASHETILHQTIQPLVLITVDISLPQEEIEQQVLYWLAILSSLSSPDTTKTIHVLIVGSHADQVKFKDMKKIQKQVSSLVSERSSFKYHGFIQCDCRYSVSDNLNQLRQKVNSICKAVRLFSARDSDDSNRLCAALMHHLERNKTGQATITVRELHGLVTKSIHPQSGLTAFIDQALLLKVCKLLSSDGHLLLLPHNENELESVLILDKNVILSRVHACLQAKKVLTNKIGMFEEKQLMSFLHDLLADMMEPNLAIKYLVFAQFCTEITDEQLISVPENFTGENHYFFPNLVSASRPADIVLPGDSHYTSFYTWGIKCASLHHFLTPRFLHTLFVQLVKCEKDNVNAKFTIWKNGILLVHHNATRSIIEVTDQTTRLYLTMQCVKGYESLLVKQRSELITLIKLLLVAICPKVKHTEYLLHPGTLCPFDGGEELPLADVAQSVVHGYPTVLVAYKDGMTPKHVPIKDLLHFDPFHAIKDKILQDIFRYRQSTNVVSSSTFNAVCSSMKVKCKPLAKELALTQQMTCKEFFEELIQYSIFTDGNLYVSYIIMLDIDNIRL